MSHTLHIHLRPENSRALADLSGQFEAHIKQIEQRFDVLIHHRGNQFSVSGAEDYAHCAANLIQQLYKDALDGKPLTPDSVHLSIQEARMQADLCDQRPRTDLPTPYQASTRTRSNSTTKSSMASDSDSILDNTEKQAEAVDQAINKASIIQTKKVTVKPRGQNQQAYVQAVRGHDINFGVGPAGTGKTYLAVACAVEAYLENTIERILLVRPAVEAGEKLGFLPGDLSQKVDPYLRPLYDALYEMMGFETVGKLLERQVIEIAPLAYMRGRTLNNSFVILDESQNTTREQMKMFLTRIGFGTTAVITGDPSQVDLPRGQASGLRHALSVLSNVDDISINRFTFKDVVRHPIVARIVEAYERAEEAQEHAKENKEQEKG